MKKTDAQYREEWKTLGMRFGFGIQVCRHITNSYKDKYSFMPYDEALLKIRKEAEKKLVEVNRLHKFAVADFVQNISRNTGGIDTSKKITSVAEADFPRLIDAINKVGYLKGIISACKRLKPEQLQEWVEYQF